jgi:hypothetical protein
MAISVEPGRGETAEWAEKQGRTPLPWVRIDRNTTTCVERDKSRGKSVKCRGQRNEPGPAEPLLAAPGGGLHNGIGQPAPSTGTGRSRPRSICRSGCFEGPRQRPARPSSTSPRLTGKGLLHLRPRLRVHGLLRVRNHLHRRRQGRAAAPRLPHRPARGTPTSSRSATCCCTASCPTPSRSRPSTTPSPTTRWCTSSCATSSTASVATRTRWPS